MALFPTAFCFVHWSYQVYSLVSQCSREYWIPLLLWRRLQHDSTALEKCNVCKVHNSYQLPFWFQKCPFSRKTDTMSLVRATTAVGQCGREKQMSTSSHKASVISFANYARRCNMHDGNLVLQVQPRWQHTRSRPCFDLWKEKGHMVGGQLGYRTWMSFMSLGWILTPK